MLQMPGGYQEGTGRFICCGYRLQGGHESWARRLDAKRREGGWKGMEDPVQRAWLCGVGRTTRSVTHDVKGAGVMPAERMRTAKLAQVQHRLILVFCVLPGAAFYTMLLAAIFGCQKVKWVLWFLRVAYSRQRQLAAVAGACCDTCTMPVLPPAPCDKHCRHLEW